MRVDGLTTALLMMLALTTADARAQVVHRSASLNGAQEVPPVLTAAGGWAIARIDAANAIAITVQTSGVLGSSAHLHLGAPGQLGPVIVPLAGGPSLWTGSGTLTPAQRLAFDGGDCYVNVHSVAHPGGELRGQLQLARSTRYDVQLNSSQLVPPGPSTATAWAESMYLVEPENVLVSDLRQSGMRIVQSYEIRHGAPGAAGPLLFAFAPNTPQGYAWRVSRRLDTSELQWLARGELYVELVGQWQIAQPTLPHLRGQLLADVGGYCAQADGAAVVPPVGSGLSLPVVAYHTTGAEWQFGVSDPNNLASACSVRNAPLGSNGAVVFTMGRVGPGFIATRNLTMTERADLLAGRWYVELTSAAFPAGAARAQLDDVVDQLPSEYGGACPDSQGNRWRLTWSRVPCVGMYRPSRGLTFRVTMIGGHPAPFASLGYLLVGFSRDLAAGLPLPLRLDLLGASPECFLLTEIAVALPSGFDVGTWEFTIPSVPSLRGAPLYQQAILLDAAAPGSFAVSSGLAVTIR